MTSITSNPRILRTVAYASAAIMMAIATTLISTHRRVQAQSSVAIAPVSSSKAIALSQKQAQTTPDYTVQYSDTIYLVGLVIESSFAGDRYLNDLQTLWEQYAQTSYLAAVEDTVDEYTYVAYTNYGARDENDVTVVLGHRVANVDAVPPGLEAIAIPASQYAVFSASGNLDQSIPERWEQAETLGLNRTYTTDLEIYIDLVTGDDSKAEVWASVQ